MRNKNYSFSAVLESYNIIDDPDLIAVEAFIYQAFESDISSAKELKTNLNKLAKAKASGDESDLREAKEDVKESIDEVNKAANDEKDAQRKAKLKKIAKIGGIIAGAIATAATIAVVAKNVKERKARGAEIEKRIDENNAILRKQREELVKAIEDLDSAKASYEKTHANLPKLKKISDEDAKKAADSIKARIPSRLKTDNSETLKKTKEELSSLLN